MVDDRLRVADQVAGVRVRVVGVRHPPGVAQLRDPAAHVATVGVATGRFPRSARAACAWTRAGAIYMTAAIARVAIGFAAPHASKWFSSHISGTFHLVLAAFVLAMARYHRQVS